MYRQDLTDDEFATLRTLAHAKWGLDVNPAKAELVKGRLLQLVASNRVQAIGDIVRLLQAGDDPSLELEVFDVLSTNMTSFFREPAHFECLAREVLEPLVRSGKRRPIRLWSAACSKGCEPYSMAMVLRETVPAHAGWDAKILASDLSQSVLTEARRGVYDANLIADLPQALVARHFVQGQGAALGKVRVSAELHKLVTFALINLNAAWKHTGPFDAIFCRNVMIYFDESTRKRLISRLQTLLRPGGLLVLGSSESLSEPPNALSRVQPAVYRAA